MAFAFNGGKQGTCLMATRARIAEDEVSAVVPVLKSTFDAVAESTTGPLGIKTRKPGNLGFDGRVFLSEAEHQTYLRRRPVRYVRTAIPASQSCSVCGHAGSVENPLQVAHVVPFGLGVVHFKLTPEWLDSPGNLRWAHRRGCNKAAELTLEQAAAHLVALGIRPADALDALPGLGSERSNDG